jgi:hypothetical protein
MKTKFFFVILMLTSEVFRITQIPEINNKLK